MNWFPWFSRSRPPARPADELDAVVFERPGATWRARDLVQGVFITGATGSGKTSGPLRALLEVALVRGYGAMVFSAKPGEADEHVRLARACGRGADVVLVDRGARHRVNLCAALDNPRADVSTRAALIAGGIGTLMEVAGRGGARAGAEGDKFWKQSADRALQNIVLILLIAGLPVTPAAVMQILQSLPTSPRALTSAWFKAGACYQALQAAHANRAHHEPEYRAAKDWALLEMATLSPKTKSVVVATLTGTLDAASRGVVAQIIATDTTLDLGAALRANRVVLCDFSYPEWMDTARFLYAALKHLVQLEALRRPVTPSTKPFLIVSDEYQNICSEHDFLYASMSRSCRCPLVVCTQGHESLHAVFPGDNGRSKVQTLIGNLVSKFYCLPTPTTASELCEALGRRRVFLSNASTQAGGYESPFDLLVPGPSRASGGVSETFESVLHPADLARMRTGGPGHDFTVDALLVQSGRVFGTGFCFTPWSFSQRS